MRVIYCQEEIVKQAENVAELLRVSVFAENRIFYLRKGKLSALITMMELIYKSLSYQQQEKSILISAIKVAKYKIFEYNKIRKEFEKEGGRGDGEKTNGLESDSNLL